MHESVAEVVVIGVPDENLGEVVCERTSFWKQTNVTEEEMHALLHITFSKI